MSYEPPGYPPPPADVPAFTTPPSSDPGARLTLPGVFLIGVALINLVGAVVLLIGWLQLSGMETDDFAKVVAEGPGQRERLEELKKQGYTLQDLKRIYERSLMIGGIVTLVAALLVAAGGMCMLMRKAWSLAMLASITAAVPCISPVSCCLIGMIVGIWSLVVLMKSDVKASFR